MNDILKEHILGSFIFGKKYRIWRHIAFIAFAAIITFNQVFIAYQDGLLLLGQDIYLIGIALLAIYLIAMYLNYFYLTPRVLLKSRLRTYSIAIMIAVFSLPIVAVAIEYWVRNLKGLSHRITNYSSPLILVDTLSTSIITLICFCGISLILLFRNWSSANQHVSKLEEEHLLSELNKLKGQITPDSLSQALQNASTCATADPKRANDILLTLSELLRYQLYDCQQEKTLLNSELQYIAKFMALEKLCRPYIQYKIDNIAHPQHYYISPMLLLTLVQYVTKDAIHVALISNIENNELTFICKSDSFALAADDTITLIRKRLDLAYANQYKLQITTGSIELKMELSA